MSLGPSREITTSLEVPTHFQKYQIGKQKLTLSSLLMNGNKSNRKEKIFLPELSKGSPSQKRSPVYKEYLSPIKGKSFEYQNKQTKSRGLFQKQVKLRNFKPMERVREKGEHEQRLQKLRDLSQMNMKNVSEVVPSPSREVSQRVRTIEGSAGYNRKLSPMEVNRSSLSPIQGNQSSRISLENSNNQLRKSVEGGEYMGMGMGVGVGVGIGVGIGKGNIGRQQKNRENSSHGYLKNRPPMSYKLTNQSLEVLPRPPPQIINRKFLQLKSPNMSESDERREENSGGYWKSALPGEGVIKQYNVISNQFDHYDQAIITGLTPQHQDIHPESSHITIEGGSPLLDSTEEGEHRRRNGIFTKYLEQVGCQQKKIRDAIIDKNAIIGTRAISPSRKLPFPQFQPYIPTGKQRTPRRPTRKMEEMHPPHSQLRRSSINTGARDIRDIRDIGDIGEYRKGGNEETERITRERYSGSPGILPEPYQNKESNIIRNRIIPYNSGSKKKNKELGNKPNDYMMMGYAEAVGMLPNHQSYGANLPPNLDNGYPLYKPLLATDLHPNQLLNPTNNVSRLKNYKFLLKNLNLRPYKYS